MSDIFISYASEDRSRVEPLAKGLETRGWSVWWDRNLISGERYSQVIEEAISGARCVVVLWSKNSIESEWVRDEADIGKDRNVLLPAVIDNVRPPMGFRQRHAADLTDWRDQEGHAGFSILLSAIESIIGPSPLKTRKTEELKRAEAKEKQRQLDEHKQREAAEKQRLEQERPPLGASDTAKDKAQGLDQDHRGRQARPHTAARPPLPGSLPTLTRKKRITIGALALVVVLGFVGWFLAPKPESLLTHQTPQPAVSTIEESPASPTVSDSSAEQKSSAPAKPEQDATVPIEPEPIEPAPERSRLFIDATPETATIKIMNIIPRFYQGIGLEPGVYRLQVSAKDHATKKFRVTIEAGQDQRVEVQLDPLDQTGDKITNTLGMEFVYIAPGTFIMGSPPNEAGRKDDERQHKVTLTRGYYLQTTEVTQGQWKAVMESNPSYFVNDCGDDCPVENVSWDDVQAYIRKLNQIEETTKYRLPTEAEWEYACRAGTETPFSFGTCLSTDQANYNGKYPMVGCERGRYRERPVDAGSLAANAWGLFDMHGNVWEWCQDRYGDYPTGAVTDPEGPPSGTNRVIRGGSWSRGARLGTSARRFSSSPDNRRRSLGFRLVREAP